MIDCINNCGFCHSEQVKKCLILYACVCFCTHWSIRQGNIVKYCILNNNYIPFIQIAGYYLNWPVGGMLCTKSNFKGIDSARIHKHNILKGGKRWMKGGTTCRMYKDGQWNLYIIDIFWLNNMLLQRFGIDKIYSCSQLVSS